MIGLSLSFCVRDICLGLIDKEQVKQIRTGTRLIAAKDWFATIVYYKHIYWSAFPEEAEEIVLYLLENDKIFQPRIYNKSYKHSIANGHWEQE